MFKVEIIEEYYDLCVFYVTINIQSNFMSPQFVCGVYLVALWEFHFITFCCIRIFIKLNDFS
jgi:hypothetical protein